LTNSHFGILVCYNVERNVFCLSFVIAGFFPVKKSEVSQDLLVRAQELWGLLPSFCRHATDTYKSFSRLSDVLATFLKKDLSMHENVSTALQVTFS
jgi:hypothetical protein